MKMKVNSLQTNYQINPAPNELEILKFFQKIKFYLGSLSNYSIFNFAPFQETGHEWSLKN